MLGGVRIPHSRGVTGHSDADVALHALVDAILGALADGDIGSHFPPSDPQWKGASSDRFLAFACERVRARRGMIAHLDVTIVCEAPRVSPHRDAMRAAHRGDRRHCSGARRGQSDDQRKARLYRTRRRHRCDGDGDDAIAVERRMIDEALRRTARRVLDLCRARGLRVATAESCTGGLVAAALTEIAGSSDVVDCGFVTYSNEAKQELLGVPAATLTRHGAVSRETAAAMAKGALKNSQADLAVAITGIAGPGGGSKRKPVGLVYFAAADRDGRSPCPPPPFWQDRPQPRAAALGCRGAGASRKACRKHIGLKQRALSRGVAVNVIGAPFEGCGEATKGGLEHGTHETPSVRLRNS